MRSIAWMTSVDLSITVTAAVPRAVHKNPCALVSHTITGGTPKNAPGCTSPQARTGVVGLEVVKVHEHVVAHVLRDERYRHTARNHGQQVVPATTHATAVLVDLERNPQSDTRSYRIICPGFG
jgi:hypothetical protein